MICILVVSDRSPDPMRGEADVAPLPTALGDSEPALVRVIGRVADLTCTWRLPTTPELRRTPRVAALFDYLIEEIDNLRPIVSG